MGVAKMVLEKPGSDNENNGEKPKKKKKLKKIKTTEIEKNEVTEPIVKIKKEKSKNLSPKQVVPPESKVITMDELQDAKKAMKLKKKEKKKKLKQMLLENKSYGKMEKSNSEEILTKI